MTYTKRKRAEQEAQTRRRIVAATVELHREVGPARTTISAIAEKAGVQRLTVYRHFPDERELLAACGSAFLAEDPPPDPDAFDEIAPALRALYAWYRRNEAMLANTERDAQTMPALAEVSDPGPYLAAFRARLLAGRRSKRARAALGHALRFSTWRSLSQEGLSDRQAAALMAELVTPGAPASSQRAI